LAATVLALVAVHVSPRPYTPLPTAAPTPGHVVPTTTARSGAVPSSASPTSKGLPKVAGFTWLDILVVVVVGFVVLVSLVGMLIALLNTLARVRGVRLGRPRRGRPAGSGPPPAERDDPDEIARVLDAGLTELDGGEPDDAIIACWLRLAEAARAAGVPGRRSDTAEDFVARVTGAGLVRAEPLERLAALYREARFSEHSMTEADRAAARAALETARAALETARAALETARAALETARAELRAGAHA
jgi:hypothetical protein